MDELLSPRTITLEVDSSGGQLGAKVTKEIAESAQRAESLDFHKWGVRADVTSVQQGIFRGKPACLIVFEFRFLFDDNGSSNRLSEAKITATFQPPQDNSQQSVFNGTALGANNYPVVKLYCPKLVEGPVSVEKHTKGTEVSVSLGGRGSLPAKPDVGIARSGEVEYLKDYRMQIKGKRWSSPGLEQDNMAIWTVLENSKQGDGIPPDFKSAVLLQHTGQPFQGTLRILAKTKMGIRLFGWPWSAPNPLLFKPDASLGQQLDFSDFDQLSDEHWRQLCDFPGVVSSCRWTENSTLITQDTAALSAQPV
ncbi:hypothetical protein K469DRAFT_748696 [Zopfia rhizophila CBS 207.26]|uniref:Uncharacterized protein n=1 Tax=Zopfia rhizophila CBS 207.26 TaxID=1314779 RepID=A0A6A6E8U0_9PEZI|nr:hypothetical protein K469DRAFT_748696 [Zopfia rhizophila CBS 207.26]